MPVGPGRADVLVGMRMGSQQNAVNDTSLSPHSPGQRDVGVPRGRGVHVQCLTDSRMKRLRLLPGCHAVR